MNDDAPPVDWFPTFGQLRRRCVKAGDKCPCLSGKKYRDCCSLTLDLRVNVISPMHRNQDTNR